MMKHITTCLAAIISMAVAAESTTVEGVSHRVLVNSSEREITSVQKRIEQRVPILFGVRHAAQSELNSAESVQLAQAKGNPNVVAAVDAVDLASKLVTGKTLSGSSVGMIGLGFVSSTLSGSTYDNVFPKIVHAEYAKYQDPAYVEIVSMGSKFDLSVVERHLNYIRSLGLKIAERTEKGPISTIGEVKADFLTHLNWSNEDVGPLLTTQQAKIGDQYWTYTSPSPGKWVESWKQAIAFAGYASIDAFLERAKQNLPAGFTLVYYLDADHRGVFRNGEQQVYAVFPDPRKAVTVAKAD